jgi:hypothetical protein
VLESLSRAFLLYSSTDAGVTWTVRHLSPEGGLSTSAAGASFGALSCPSPTLCFAAGTVSLPTQSAPALFRVDLVRNTIATLATFSDAGAIYAMACPDGRTCWASGQGAGTPVGGYLVYTPDGGLSVSVIGNLPSPTPPLPALACPSPAHCVVAGSETIAVTRDSGVTWVKAGLPLGASDVTSLSCPTDEQCFALASSQTKKMHPPVVLSSHDGGIRWRIVAGPPSSFVATSLACTTSACFLGGFSEPAEHAHGLIYEAPLGSSAWVVAESEGSFGPIQALSCSGHGTCLAEASLMDSTSAPASLLRPGALSLLTPVPQRGD